VADSPKKEEMLALSVDNRDLTVRLTEHARARRLSLRVDPINGCVVLVKPRRASKKAAIAFAEDKADWIADRLAELVLPVPFADGSEVPIHGELHTIRHCPEARRGVWRENNHLNISGAADHLSRRIHDWFRDEARHVIIPIAHSYAETLGRTVTNISIRDTRSRWGSCSADGRLSFSWRLIMTPTEVTHYVIAHEVSHLCEFNHSARFWSTVDQLIDDRREQTQWLKEHGGDLHRYGLNEWKNNPSGLRSQSGALRGIQSTPQSGATQEPSDPVS
jgi:predicted metal-dependent hydrolase